MKYEPDKTYLIADNTEAMKLADHVLHLMKPRDGCNQTHHCFETDHHWCQVTHFTGHEDEKENGYSVVMVPKKAKSKLEAAVFFEDIRRNTREAGYEHLSYAEFHPIPKATNN